MSHISYIKTPEILLDTRDFLNNNDAYPVVSKISHISNTVNGGGKRKHKLFEADNLLTLIMLQTSHQQKVDVIYIDPPYNTKNNDFTYSDTYTTKADKHSVWLSIMERRLILAKNLLKEDGFICVSIDNNEGFHLKLLMDKVFGENNFVDSFIWVNNKAGRTLSKHVSHQYEFIHMYAKNKSKLVIEPEKIFVESDSKEFKYEDNISRYSLQGTLMNGHPTRFNMLTRPNLAYAIYYNEKNGHIVCKDDKTASGDNFSEPDKKLTENGYIRILPKWYDSVGYGCFRWSQEKLLNEYTTNVVFKKDSDGNIYPYTKRRIFNNVKEVKRQSIIEIGGRGAGTDLRHVIGKNFPYPKPVHLIQQIISMHPNKNAVVLDFFAGSGTTGQAVLEINHKDGGDRTFILATNNEDGDGTQHKIAENITNERIERVITGNWVSPQEQTRTYPDDTFTYYRITSGTLEDSLYSMAEMLYNVTFSPVKDSSGCIVGYKGEGDDNVFLPFDHERVELADDELLQIIEKLAIEAKNNDLRFIFLNPTSTSISDDINNEHVIEERFGVLFSGEVDRAKQQVV